MRIISISLCVLVTIALVAFHSPTVIAKAGHTGGLSASGDSDAGDTHRDKLTKTEYEVLVKVYGKKANGPAASPKDEQVAKSICKEKCKPCFDGSECNPDCVRQHCIGKRPK